MPRRFPLLAPLLVLALLPRPLAAQTPEPMPWERTGQEGYARPFADVLADLDAFWAGVLRSSGATYRSPGVVPLERPVQTGCGPADPSEFAFYCRVDATIYYSPLGLAAHNVTFGDFAPIVVIAHEWGHHVQNLLGLAPGGGNGFELQADCAAGAYAADAAERGLLDPGDLTEAVTSSGEYGDPLGLPQDAPGAHGTSDDRITAFMRGDINGVGGCGFSLPDAPLPAPPPPSGRPAPAPNGVPALAPALPALAPATLVPATLSLPQGQRFRLYDGGAAAFDDVVAGLPDPAQARQSLLAWGWRENAYRVFAADNPPPNAVGWVELSVDRFDTVDGAAAALPVYAAARRARLGLQPVDVGLFADQTEAMAGPAYNGDELTIYARRGTLLFRATGIAPNGDPTADVFEALLIPLRPLADEPRVVSPRLIAALPPAAMAPPGLRIAEDHARSGGTIAATFPDVAGAERTLQRLGWRESASRNLVAVGAGAVNGTTRMEVALHRFATEDGAAQALPYFLGARAAGSALVEVAAPAVGDEARAIEGPVEGGREATVYVRVGTVLLRVTAVGSVDPMRDVEALLG